MYVYLSHFICVGVVCGLVPRLLATWYWFEPAPVPTGGSNGDPIEGTAGSRTGVGPAPVPTGGSNGDPFEVSAESRTDVEPAPVPTDETNGDPVEVSTEPCSPCSD